MSEYVIDSWDSDWDDCISDKTPSSVDEYCGTCVGKITRCKDCMFCRKMGLCGHEFFICTPDEHDEDGQRSIDEDGFCAWGKPRDDAE